MRLQHRGGLGAGFEGPHRHEKDLELHPMGREEPMEGFQLDSDMLGLLFWKQPSS